MPKVKSPGKKSGMKFPYTKKGMEEAHNYAKQSGRAVEMEGNYRGGGMIPKYQMGGAVPPRGPMAPRRPMPRPGMRPGARPPMPGMRPGMRPPMPGARPGMPQMPGRGPQGPMQNAMMNNILENLLKKIKPKKERNKK